MIALEFLEAGSIGAFLIHTVDDGNRLRLPLQTAKFVPWLKEGPRTAKMVLGQYGGAQLWHSSIPIVGDNELQQIQTGLKDSPAKPEESATEWMRLVRYALLRCEVEFKADGKHYSIGLPREFRDMGILPNSGERAAIVISGAIIEIWRTDKLEAHVGETRGKLSHFIDLAVEQFGRRD
jgi:hypothetical protein